MITVSDLRKNALFADVNVSELRRILPTMRQEYYPRSAPICKEGESGSCLYLLLSGQVKLMITEGPYTETLGYLNAGDFFGETALLTNEPRAITAEAVIDAEVLLLGRQSFYNLVERNATVMHNVVRTIDLRIQRRALRMFHQQPKHSQIISIYSPKKVSIKTFVAVNLAVSLHRQTAQPVAILDMTIGAPSIAQILKMNQGQSFGTQDINEECITSLLCAHSTGFELLTISEEHLQHGRVSREKIAGILGILKTLFQYIIINTSAEISNNTFEALDLSDRVVLLSPFGKEPICGMFDHQELITTYYFSQDIDSQGQAHLSESAPLIIPSGQLEEQHFYEEGEIIVSKSPDSERSKTIDRIARHVADMRIGLALGGMAARGISHVGILKMLEEHNIPIDMIAGSNVGAVVGSLYALGRSATEIESMILDLRKYLPLLSIKDVCLLRGGLLKNDRIFKLLGNYLPTSLTFHDLKIPLRIITMALDAGQEVPLNSGSLLKALEAALAMPGIFQPVNYNGKFLIDGSTINPVPTSDLLEMGADILIGVNSFAPLTPSYTAPPKDYQSLVGYADNLKLVDIITRSFQNLQYEISTGKGTIADVTITPDLVGYTWNDFSKMEDIIEAGQKAAEESLPQLQSVINDRRLYRKI
ncbi:hypothetical protein CSB45_06790 [candidate division KSB3 bacterium]|uniref:Cyclic nucleotide-binding domain-containing protein n=1 Tax=candidate division KSB3 bacterium TaxID=2044937 RepID=A0A2G6E615_9BACT|nr:MAG: hypothetical protein CSB45_06790 [candidate division KSB3 bacterium]PIE30058.1 MAG: hypothetical protein CSA57_05805 [candidate division KSB3 bacterium]